MALGSHLDYIKLEVRVFKITSSDHYFLHFSFRESFAWAEPRGKKKPDQVLLTKKIISPKIFQEYKFRMDRDPFAIVTVLNEETTMKCSLDRARGRDQSADKFRSSSPSPTVWISLLQDGFVMRQRFWVEQSELQNQRDGTTGPQKGSYSRKKKGVNFNGVGAVRQAGGGERRRAARWKPSDPEIARPALHVIVITTLYYFKELKIPIMTQKFQGKDTQHRNNLSPTTSYSY
ncbi:hypothetical protein MG293_006920 [Ovis ammon polii]|uniref:Uncharacterized protein n=1 Tax=Ovis ammon polii TaxID=230172 RepID=A0AAD4UEU8_OVIAM|nr:hypothetical protein MG293_006920 [Ovis ammon polii]